MTAIVLFAACNPSLSLAAVVGSPVQAAIQPVASYSIPTLAQVMAAAVPPVEAAAPARNLTAIRTVQSLEGQVDCTAQPCIALTFDDGPNRQTTPAVMQILAAQHAAASFFLVGRNIAGNEDLVRQMVLDGFEIGNHTWDHHDLTQLPPDQVQDELLRTQTAIAAAGAPLPTLFRPPYGAIDPSVAASAGLQTALWNEDPRDWQATDPAALAATIVAAARPGGVVDLHDIHQVTVDALPAVINQLRGQGYQFVTVSKLLHSRDRPGTAPFYGYAADVY